MNLPDLTLTAVREAAALVFPVWCAGCDAPGDLLCPGCASAFDASAERRRSLDGLEVRSCTSYAGAAARVVRALKEEGRTSLARHLGSRVGGLLARSPWPDAVIVPIPSSRAAFRRRGYAVAELLARRSGAHWERGLRVRRRVDDQRSLGREARSLNVDGTFAAIRRIPHPVVLLDDVVTTGATLVEARRALRAAGMSVVGALSVADTPRRDSPVPRP